MARRAIYRGDVRCGGDFSDICRLPSPSGTAPIMDRLLVFKLGGAAHLPPRPARIANSFDLPPEAPSAAQVERGKPLFDQYCAMCHGDNAASSGLNPDLRYSHFLKGDAIYSVVLDGALRSRGMASFAGVLGRDEVGAIRAYIIDRARAEAH